MQYVDSDVGHMTADKDCVCCGCWEKAKGVYEKHMFDVLVRNQLVRMTNICMCPFNKLFDPMGWR